VETGRRSARSAPIAIAAALLGILAVALVASTPASPFQPLVPEGYGPGPLGGLSRLVGLDRLSRDPLAGVGIVCMVVATAAFCWALLEAWRGRISLRTALLVGLALQALAVAVPLLFSRDVYSYAIYGRIWTVHGENPYLAVPSDFRTDGLYPLVGEEWQDTPAVYGPAFTMLSGALARVLDDPIPLITAFKVLAGVASAALLVLVAWLSRRVRPQRAAFAVLLLGWNPVMLFHTVAGGHNDVLVGLAIVGALALVYEGRNLAATAVLAAGALVKAPALLPLVLLVAAVVAARPPGRRLREAGAHLLVAAGLFLAAAAPFLQLQDPTLGQLELAGHQGWLAPSNLFGRVSGKLGELLGGEAGRTIGQAALRIAFPVILVVAFLAIVRHVVRRAREIGPEGIASSWAWALIVFTVCAPVLLPWYAAWTLPLAWLLPRVPRLSAIGIAVALTVSEVVAEPLRGRAIFEAMVLALHYVITPAVFVVLLWLLADLRHRLGLGVPLEADGRQVPAGRR
jgi:hypothetical protein